MLSLRNEYYKDNSHHQIIYFLFSLIWDQHHQVGLKD
jgi:hypothetical protein